METKTKNLFRGFGKGILGSIKTIIIPYYIYDFISSSGSEAMFSAVGDVAVIQFWIISLGLMSVALTTAKGFSPKNIYSVRKAMIGVLQTMLGWMYLYSFRFSVGSAIRMNLGPMGYIIIDIAPYLLIAMAMATIKIVLDVYDLIEAIIKSKSKEELI